MAIIGVETKGPWSKAGREWLNHYGQKIIEVIGDIRAHHFKCK